MPPEATDPYRALGLGYAQRRRPEPRIAARMADALGDARTVVNVGAGAGSYEPAGRCVLAVDPSATMLAQRRPGAAPAVLARAEALPLPDDACDAALAVLTVHHWSDPAAGLAELARVARRQVVLTRDPGAVARFWLVADYLPEIAELEADLACVDVVAEVLGRSGCCRSRYRRTAPTASWPRTGVDRRPTWTRRLGRRRGRRGCRPRCWSRHCAG